MKKLSFFLLLLLVVFTAQAQIQEPVTVSYTHLTLPTKRIV